jgi:hypothetical protein
MASRSELGDSRSAAAPGRTTGQPRQTDRGLPESLLLCISRLGPPASVVSLSAKESHRFGDEGFNFFRGGLKAVGGHNHGHSHDFDGECDL